MQRKTLHCLCCTPPCRCTDPRHAARPCLCSTGLCITDARPRDATPTLHSAMSNEAHALWHAALHNRCVTKLCQTMPTLCPAQPHSAVAVTDVADASHCKTTPPRRSTMPLRNLGVLHDADAVLHPTKPRRDATSPCLCFAPEGSTSQKGIGPLLEGKNYVRIRVPNVSSPKIDTTT